MWRRAVPSFVLVLAAAVIGAGCAETSARTPTSPAARRVAGTQVLVMPPDVELSEMTAGGLLEPRAEWTQQAVQHVARALRTELTARQAHVVEYRAPADGSPRAHQHVDWSLGDGASVLREDSDAQYALFVLFRDSFASGGRVAAMLGAAVLGVALPGGRQVGFASLVDLRNGDIIWFNRLFDAAGPLCRARHQGREAVARQHAAVMRRGRSLLPVLAAALLAAASRALEAVSRT